MDGGSIAWLQVLASWLLYANTWGLTNSFGVFQNHYTTVMLSSSTPLAISWIGSLQTFLTMATGLFAGVVLDSGHLRSAMLVGISLQVLGMLMTSISSEYWHFVIAQGLCVGLGSGILSIVSLVILPLYWRKRKMTAGGIAATGSGLAGVLYPIMLRRLFHEVGFPWAVRCLALLMLAMDVLAFLAIRPKTPERPSGPLFRLHFLKDKNYALWVICFAFLVAAVYTPYFYDASFALSIGIDEQMAIYALSIMNASTLIGRLPPALLADRFGPINVLAPCTIGTIAILFSWLAVKSLPGLIITGALFCFVTGGMVSLMPLTVTNLTEDAAEYGTRIGMAYTIASIGALLGNPIAGATLYRKEEAESGPKALQLDFRGLWVFSGSSMAIAGLLMLWIRYRVAGLSCKVV
ncbi:major facilitator superfamily transporter [Truncatella angustata]|uniref:Major facilitator superfamily transporter n=1 Tax=Truncatella angustata TaxID=152316 RepID=A0A9P9A2X0_9PEZI|nr:major facilitator superfamily transporter [Truncatella angustata]KAH6661186.1 major facilitator superfamily transporter [Truncatella angustata]